MSKRMCILRPRARASKEPWRAPVRRADSQEQRAMAHEQTLRTRWRSQGPPQRSHRRRGHQRSESARNARDEYGDMRARTSGLILGRCLSTRRRRLDDRAATRTANRCRGGRFVLLRRRSTAASRTHLAVEAAQILRSSAERDRWQEHHQRENDREDTAHGGQTVCRALAFRKWPFGATRRRGRVMIMLSHGTRRRSSLRRATLLGLP